MGLFDSFFGKSQRRDISAANADATRLLNDGFGQARAALEGATGTGRQDIAGGFDAAGNYINAGMAGATGAINQGYDAAGGNLRDQYGRAEQSVQSGYDRAAATLDPFITSGTRAQGLYDTALGLDGQPAAQDFYSTYANNDPFRQFRDSLANQQLMSLYNARGLGGSGRESLALSRASLERGTQDLNAYLDRLSGQAGRGASLASQLSGYGMQTGQSLANIQQGLGQGLSNLDVGRGTALGNIQTQGNQALASNAQGRGTTLANFGLSTANNLANLAAGQGQQLASNRISFGNAMAGTRNTGINNLMQLAGTAMKGYSTFAPTQTRQQNVAALPSWPAITSYPRA